MQIVRSYILLTIIPLLFLGNVGFDVFKHTCKEDGVTTAYVINTIDHCEEHLEELPPCCQEKHKKDDCCDDEISFFQIKLDYFQKVLDHKFIPVQDLEPAVFAYVVPEYNDKLHDHLRIISDPSPPDNNRRQAILQVFTI